MIRVKVNVKRSGNLASLKERLLQGVETGMAIGGEIMSQAVEASANDMARYPTGELEASITYDPESSGVVTTGRIVAGTDHAQPFNFGAGVHFVPYDEADERIKAGLYPHIKPVYGDETPMAANAPSTFWSSNVTSPANRQPIGYLVSSSPHPFMEEGFNATKDALVQEIANQIAAATER